MQPEDIPSFIHGIPGIHDFIASLVRGGWFQGHERQAWHVSGGKSSDLMDEGL